MIEISNRKILVIAAHPDDEILGCGGSLNKFSNNNCEIHIIFMTNGVSSRNIKNKTNLIALRQKSAKQCTKLLGVKKNYFLDFPDNKLDSIPLLKIIKKIEYYISKIKPDHILTHSEHDLNIDHRLTYQATLTACRPDIGQIISLISFEIPSSTEYSLNSNFKPNLFIDISEFIINKIKCLNFHSKELRDFPHPRSIKNIVNLNNLRGSTVGIKSAEAFEIKKLTI